VHATLSPSDRSEREKEREIWNMVALFLFLKGMTGAWAPLSYPVLNIW